MVGKTTTTRGASKDWPRRVRRAHSLGELRAHAPYDRARKPCLVCARDAARSQEFDASRIATRRFSVCSLVLDFGNAQSSRADAGGGASHARADWFGAEDGSASGGEERREHFAEPHRARKSPVDYT